LDRLSVGNKTIYLDNKVPALIQDAFSNLGYEQKDGTKPVIAEKRKTNYGWHLVWQLPPGVSFAKVRSDKDTLQDSCNSWIELLWRKGKCHMDVYHGDLDDELIYSWDPSLYPKMNLPLPIGYSQKGLEVLDLPKGPHVLVGGVTNYGKSNVLHTWANALLQARAIVCIIDHKRLDFGYLQDLCILARREAETLALLEALNNEMERRIDKLEAAGVVKIQDYQGDDMPYIVLIIDELAEANSEKAMYYIDRLVRLARAVGISVIAATQRPSTKVIPGDTRANFAVRICFQAADETSSRVILGETCSAAAWLPAIPGRCIYKYGLTEREVQAMYLPHEKARELAKQFKLERRWDINVKPTEPKIKRLTPR